MAKKKVLYYRDWDELPVLLRLEECAVILDTSYETVRKWATSGKIPAVKIADIWRVDKRKLQALFENNQDAAIIKAFDSKACSSL